MLNGETQVTVSSARPLILPNQRSSLVKKSGLSEISCGPCGVPLRDIIFWRQACM
jgi:hypothetical protein